MRFSKLLVLSSLWLGMASAANAEVPQSQWTIPEPQGLEFTTFTDDGTRYYLYNPGAKMFFASGNSWNTQASVRTFGYPFWVEPTTEVGAPDGAYELWDDFNNPDRADVTGPHNVFCEGESSTFVDHASQANYSWTLTFVGDFVRFQNVAMNDEGALIYEGKYIGWDGSYKGEKYSSVLRMLLPDEPGVCVDWRAVTTDSYEAFTASDAYTAYTNGVACYFLAQQLRELLVEAEEIGADVAAQLAVFTNLNSTPDELTAAIAAAQAAIDKRKQELIDNDYDNATVEKPVDVTAKFLRNFDFKGDDLTTGWSGDAFGSYGPKENAEHYNKTYNTYQDVNGGMKPGVYALGVKAFYRAGNSQPAWDNYKANNAASKLAKVYGKVGTVEREASIISPCVAMLPEGTEGLVGAWSAVNDADEYGDIIATYVIPNNMEAAEYAMHTLGLYDNKVLVAVMAETDTLRIGVRKSSSIDGDWSIFDDFSLTYYGQGADACNLYLAEALKNFSDYTPDEGVLYTEAYLTAYREALAGDKTANSLEEVNTVLGTIDKSYADLMKNIELWKDYQALLNKGTGMAAEAKYEGIEEMLDMMDYIDMESADIINALELTNEELEAAIAQLNEWIEIIIDKSKKDVWEGKDMTEYITNPGFDEDKDINSGAAEGWTIDRISGGNVVRGPLGQANQDIMVKALNEQNFCFESWHCHKWDVWQEIKGLRTGMYELQVQGYVRCEVIGYKQGDPIEPDFPSPVYLYMNSAQTSFPSVYDETIAPSHYLEDGTLPVVEGHSWNGTVANYPNSMGAASLCFKWGMYKKQAYGLIAKDGDTFRIGVKMDADQDWWCIWDNFKLIYHEPTAEIVQPVLEEELAKIDLSKPMGKDVYELAETLKAAALEAIASGDGQEMFKALSDLYDLNDAINTSVALFVRLQKAVENLWDYISASDNESAIADGKALYIEITDGIDNHAITDAEAEAYIDKIATMKTTLALPSEVANATDSNPVNVTAVIQTPTFDKDYVNSIDGWITAGYNFGNDDTQKGALALEFYNKTFDIHQDIVGLPEGTYEVGVKAFSRNGGTAEDFNTYAENPNFSLAFLYAINGDSAVSSVPVAPLSKGATSEDPAISGQTSYTPAGSETTYYFPNDMVSAVAFFDMEGSGYDNKVVVKVLADGKLTIGMKKTETLPYCWVLLDSWSLTYYGNNSKLEPNGDASGIEEAVKGQNVRVEYFTLDGRKANGTEKGVVIQKMTFDNGIVLVKKLTK
ncbi:MAG: hypothetical protein IJ892_01655 [Prevotella sp.]|nr:hypothetical protein [Prevotella sp.]